MSPFEIVFDEPPDYSLIKPFGCLAFAANLVFHKGKFDSRSIKIIFIRFDSAHKGYLLYDLEIENVFISRDVKFVTDTFPFTSTNPNNHEPNLPFPAVSPMDECTSSLEVDNSLSPATAPSVLHNSTTSTEHNLNEAQPELRRSQRIRAPPVWMKDYVGSLNLSQPISLTSSLTPPTFPYSISPALSKSYISYLFNLTMIKEPSSYK